MRRILIMTLAVLLFAAPMYADTIIFHATLSGPGESPPNASPGTGTATVTLNTIAQTLRVQVTFSGLTTGTTASHIHCCTTIPFTGTAGVATTTPTFVGFPLGVTSGAFDSTLDLTSAGSYNPAFVTANGGTPTSAEAVLIAGMLAGESYLNIHTTQNPGGEIRGFLVAAEPASMVLLGTGLLSGLALRRRKR